MCAPLAARSNVEAADLRRLARREQDRQVTARLIVPTDMLDSMSREATAPAAWVERQTAPDRASASTPRVWVALRGQPPPGPNQG